MKEGIFIVIMFCVQSVQASSAYTPLAGDLTILPNSMTQMLAPSHMHPVNDQVYESGSMHLTRAYQDKILEYKNNQQYFGKRIFQFELEFEPDQTSLEFAQYNVQAVHCIIFGTDRSGRPREWHMELHVDRTKKKKFTIDPAIKIEKIAIHADGFLPVSFTVQEQPLLNESGSFVVAINQSANRYGFPFLFVNLFHVQSFKQAITADDYVQHKVAFVQTLQR